MGRAYYPTQAVESVYVSNVSVTTASFVLLAVGGTIYPNGYRINYNNGYRLFSPILASNGNVYITCVSLAYGEDLPAMSLSNVEVYIIG